MEGKGVIPCRSGGIGAKCGGGGGGGGGRQIGTLCVSVHVFNLIVFLHSPLMDAAMAPRPHGVNCVCFRHPGDCNLLSDFIDEKCDPKSFDQQEWAVNNCAKKKCELDPARECVSEKCHMEG